MATMTIHAPGTTKGYRYDVTAQAPGANLPQRIGAKLWLPMLAMALMAFPVALGLAIARSTKIADGGSPATIAALGHFVPAAMFIGFASVFAAIAFWRGARGQLRTPVAASGRSSARPTPP